MAKILQFPSIAQITKADRLAQLNEFLDEHEQALASAMIELDELNEEIVLLTHEYNRILTELKDIIMQE